MILLAVTLVVLFLVGGSILYLWRDFHKEDEESRQLFDRRAGLSDGAALDEFRDRVERLLERFPAEKRGEIRSILYRTWRP